MGGAGAIAATNGVTTADGRPRGKKRGPKAKNDAGEDKRTTEHYEAAKRESGVGIKDWCRNTGRDYQRTDRAIKRHREKRSGRTGEA